MSTLPKIRVTEKHGMRRFLYPLETILTADLDTDFSRLSLRTNSGVDVPYCIAERAGDVARVRFAVSLSPLESVTLTFVEASPAAVPDGLQLDATVEGLAVRTTQQRLVMEIDDQANLSRVFYDNVDHLRGPVQIARNEVRFRARPVSNDGVALLSEIGASVKTVGAFANGPSAHLSTELTACKSWAHVRMAVEDLPAGDVITFTLPFAVKGEDLLCDFGAGGGIYTRLSRKPGASVIWSVDRELIWKLSNGDRLDYQGRLAAREQLWFHVVDAEKSIAVAITDIPDDLAAITAGIDTDGDIVIAFVAGATGPSTRYGVCYHFLNNVPAIAAATCPQSILLPPVVE